MRIKEMTTHQMNARRDRIGGGSSSSWPPATSPVASSSRFAAAVAKAMLLLLIGDACLLGGSGGVGCGVDAVISVDRFNQLLGPQLLAGVRASHTVCVRAISSAA